MPLEQTGSRPPQPPSAGAHHSALSYWLDRPSQGGVTSNKVTSASPGSIAPGASLGPAQPQNQAGYSHTPHTNTMLGRVATHIHSSVQPTNGQRTIKTPLPPINGQRPPAQPFSQTHITPPGNGAAANTSGIPMPHTTGFTSSQPLPPQSWSGIRGGAGTASISPRVPAGELSATNNLRPPSRQPTAPGISTSAMEQDELANTDEDDDPVPLVISDLDPRGGRILGTGTTSAGSHAKQKSLISSPSSQPASNLSLRPPSSHTPRKTAVSSLSSGASTASTTTLTKTKTKTNPGTVTDGAGKAMPPSFSLSSPFKMRPSQQPIVSIPLARPPPLSSPAHLHSPRPPPQAQHAAAPSKSQTGTVAFSVSIPFHPPNGSSGSSGSKPNNYSNSHQLPTLRPPMSQTKPRGDLVGRRTNSISAHAAAEATAAAGPQPSVQIKGGRPKGWKPGMSYREVALRNLGVDTSDPALPPEFLLSRRDRKGAGHSVKRPLGRPRSHGSNSSANGGPRRPIGRPRLHKTAQDRAMYAKRIGRPPLQTVEEVQRKIFHESTVRFVPFMCEWAGCRAELQNLATLRRHVEFVHGRGCKAGKTGKAGKPNKSTMTTGPPTCLWRKCATREPPVQFAQGRCTDDRGQGPKTFMEHMEYYHLEPLSWHQGDGFANNSHIGPPPTPSSILLAEKEAKLGMELPVKAEDDERSRKCATTATPDMAIHVPAKYVPGYLLEDGRQVTPLLRDPVLEMSSAFWSADEWGRRIKEAYRQLNRRPERGWTG